MSKVGLVVEAGRNMAMKAGLLGAGLLMEGASDATINPSYEMTKELRQIGSEPFDVFNHTGNFGVAMIGGFAASFIVLNGQRLFEKLRGTEETASLSRINRVRMGLGLLGAAAASYTLEKLGGDIDMIDVAYSLGMGAVGASMVEIDRKEVYDPDYWAAHPEKAAAISANVLQTTERAVVPPHTRQTQPPHTPPDIL